MGGVWEWGGVVFLVDICLCKEGDGVLVWIGLIFLLYLVDLLVIGIFCWLILEFIFDLIGVDLFFVIGVC